jgi:hypothetical protein
VWVAAGAIGAILGIVGVLWTYEPPAPAKSRAAAAAEEPASQQPAPPPVLAPTLKVVPKQEAPKEADRASAKEAADMQEAQKAYQQAMQQYQQALRDFAQNRITREDLARHQAHLQAQAQVVFQRLQALMAKGRSP